MEGAPDIAHEFLLQECRKKNRSAQSKIYQLYYSAMFGSAIRITGNQMEAQDIVQDSFLEAFTKIETLNSDARFGGWLKRIVINKSINQVKKAKPTLEQIRDDQTVIDDAPDDIEYTIEDVQKALNQLADGYRMVFSLYAFEGLSHAQIAEDLGINESTSKSQYNRAKKRIKEIILNNG